MTHTKEDLAINDNFEIFVNPRGDVATVAGRSRFNQNLGVLLAANYEDNIGDLDRDTIKERLRVGASRVADMMGELESVAAIDISFSDDKPNTAEVTIIYDSGDDLTFEVNT